MNPVLHWRVAIVVDVLLLWGTDVAFGMLTLQWRCILCADVKLLTDVALALLIDITHWRYNDARKWQCKLTPLLQ